MHKDSFTKRIQKMNLDAKLSLYISLLVIFSTFLMLVLSSIFTVRSLYEKSEEQTQSKLAYMVDSYDSWLDTNKDILMAMQTSPALQRFCSYDDESTQGYLPNKKEVLNYIDSQINMYSYMNFISVINQKLNSYVYNGNHSITNTGYEEAFLKGYEQSDIAKNTGQTRIYFGHSFFGGSKYSITFYQPVYSVTALDKQIGMIGINMNDKMFQSINEDVGVNTMKTFITNTSGKLLNGDAKQYNILNSNDISSLKGKKGSIYSSGKYFFYQKVDDWNFYIVSVVSKAELYRSSLEVAIIMIIIMIAFLIASLLFIRRVVKKNYEQISMVIKAMDHISNEDLSYRIQTNRMGDDMKKLGDGFNTMVDDIEGLMQTVRMEQHEIDQIRLHALQSQIQPHFLYNTLECIHWKAMADGESEVSRLILALASFYRISLSKGKDIIPLATELEHVENYLIIQNERYGDMISYEIDVDEKYKNIMIPKLTLQPLVENSIYHGIRVKEGTRGNIEIRGRRQKKLFILEIEDNGKGMKKEKIEQINCSIHNNDESFGYGLRNVNKRIQILFGSQFGLKYELTEQGGVLVKVVLPYLLDADERSIFGGE